VRNVSKLILKNIFAVVIGLLLSFILLEGLLRIFQPIEYRVKGNKIWLPRDRKYQFTNEKTDKLDKIVYTSRNYLGFRGEAPPKNFAEHLTIIAVGGSTTACELISDHNTWCDILAVKLKSKFNSVWLNNAGLDGHSTFGHIVLMEDYVIKLRPKILLFLVGANDVGLETAGLYDKQQLKEPMTGLVVPLLENLVNKSEVFSYGINFCRFFKAKRQGLIHTVWNFNEVNQLDIPPEKVLQIILEHKQKYLAPYAERLNKLMDICRINSIKPVLITQPTVFGDLVDPTTEINLGSAKTHDWNGKVLWQLLELYNDIVRNVAAQHHVKLIDLAREMPKKTEYYYDAYHFSNTGCQKVAEVIYQHSYPLLKNMQFPTGKLGKMQEDVR
jgi:hypothetical protein